MENTQTQKASFKNYVLPLMILGIMFFVIGFALGINGYLIPFLQDAFELSDGASYLVLAAAFSAFIIFGIPSGQIIKKIGYKKSMALSFLFFAIGLALFIPSAMYKSFPLFLVASFISGMGNTLLQASVNPYITIIGKPEGAVMRISLMGIMNKAAWAIAPLFLSLFLDLKNVNLDEMNLPFLIIIGSFIILGIFAYFAPLPEVKAAGEDEDDGSEASAYAANKTSIFQFPHLIMGVIALFLYVGIETIALASIVAYAEKLRLDNSETYIFYTALCMGIGYIFGVIFVPRILSQKQVILIFPIIGLICTALIYYSAAETSIWFVAALGFANSLLWPAIWPLAIADLGKFTKTGSSILVMGIVGAALIPILFGLIADQVGYQKAYLIALPIYLFIFYFGIHGHKIRTKK